jgi:hypothetical protein
MAHMHIVAGHLKDPQNQDKCFSLFFVPNRSIICEKVLEDAGVIDVLEGRIGAVGLALIPFDNDVLSLELDSNFRELYLEQDTTSLYYVAKSLMQMQSIFGLIPTIKTKGSCSKMVLNMMLRMRREQGLGKSRPPADIDSLIILDRDVDLVTPMMTQMTYEGLIDEIFGISNTFVDLEPSVVGVENAPAGRKIKQPLNSNDTLFADVRDLNFGVLQVHLSPRRNHTTTYIHSGTMSVCS